MEVWQRFTSRARRAVVLAHNEAQMAGMPLISTEHLLMGMLALGEGTALEVLTELGVPLDELSQKLRDHIVPGAAEGEPSKELAFTPEAQRVLHVAYEEARRLRSDHVGTRHLLLGLVREGRGAAHRLLRKYGVDLTRLRQAIASRPKTHKRALRPKRTPLHRPEPSQPLDDSWLIVAGLAVGGLMALSWYAGFLCGQATAQGAKPRERQ